MTRSVYVVVVASCGVIAPLLAFAAFKGPSSAPPYTNTQGLVWNIPAENPNDKQSSTEFNISGSARIGGDFFMADSKALRIDSQSYDENTTLNVGNWNSIGTFLLNVIGDIKTDSSDGATGRVYAKEYCYQDPNGNPINCIGSWPAPNEPAPETFVDVTGDTMTGQLHVAIPDGTAIFAESFGSGGYGIQAISSSIGVFGSGSSGGIYGVDSSTLKYGYVGYGNYSFYGNGDLYVPNNTRSSCVTVNVASGSGSFQCSGGKFMSGIRKNASNVVDGLICCDL